MVISIRHCTKYRAKIGRLSIQGFILASLLIIGRCAPLLAQEEAEQEVVEKELPVQSSDREIEAEQESEQESSEFDSTEQDSAGLGSSSALQDEQDSQGQDTQEQKSEQGESELAAKSGEQAQEKQAPAPEAKPATESAAVVVPATTQSSAQEKEAVGDTVVEPVLEEQEKVLPDAAFKAVPALKEMPVPAPGSAVATPGAKPMLLPKDGPKQKSGVAGVQPAVAPGAKPVAARPEQKAPATERADQAIPEEEDIVGIDTVSLDDPQGNWLFKRIWWERAEKKIEKIRRLVNAVFESRVIFLAQRTDIDRNVLDPFYVSIGLGQVELKNILDQLIVRLEKEREKEGVLSDQERDILQELRKEESALKQMKTDVENVARIDHDIDEALNTLFEQINKVREYEGDAWDNFKEIARVLNDIKARELYYTMDIIAKNIEDIQAYIHQDYTRHFNQLSVAVKQQIDRLKKSVETMRERGLDLGKQLEFLEQQEKARASGQPQAEDQDEPEADQGFFGSYIMAPAYYVGSALKSLWDGVVFVVTWPINYVTGATSDAGQEVKEEDED